MKKSVGMLLLLTLLIGCSESSGEVDVAYSVSGTASTVSITIENADGGVSQFSGVSVPWGTGFKGMPGDFVYVSAQNQGNSGSVTATIRIDGETFKTSTSSGAYVIATASGLIPE